MLHLNFNNLSVFQCKAQVKNIDTIYFYYVSKRKCVSFSSALMKEKLLPFLGLSKDDFEYTKEFISKVKNKFFANVYFEKNKSLIVFDFIKADSVLKNKNSLPVKIYLNDRVKSDVNKRAILFLVPLDCDFLYNYYLNRRSTKDSILLGQETKIDFQDGQEHCCFSIDVSHCLEKETKPKKTSIEKLMENQSKIENLHQYITLKEYGERYKYPSVHTVRKMAKDFGIGVSKIPEMILKKIFIFDTTLGNTGGYRINPACLMEYMKLIIDEKNRRIESAQKVKPKQKIVNHFNEI